MSDQSSRITQRRRQPQHAQLLLASALLFTTYVWTIEGFASSVLSTSRTRSIQAFATKEEETWSKSASLSQDSDDCDCDDDMERLESPLGVRRRVQAVLERARNRTGVRNTSIAADMKPIGGLGGLVQPNGTVGVASDLQLNLPLSLEPLNGFNDLPTRSTAVNEAELPKLVLSEPRQNSELKAVNGDVPAAVYEPLPFCLPTLSSEKKKLLALGERIQEQSKMGREGSGYVVLDVKAPPYVVWECLLDFESYPQTIPTVREVTMYTSDALTSGYHAEKPLHRGTELRHYGTPSTTRAAFCLSKFRLNIAAIHNYRPHPDGDYMIFTLDPECTNIVLKAAKGIWHTQSNPDGRGEEYTRVWLLCEIKVSSVLPAFIVDYTAKRAMPRATTWLKPQVEAAANLWLKNMPPNGTPVNGVKGKEE